MPSILLPKGDVVQPRQLVPSSKYGPVRFAATPYAGTIPAKIHPSNATFRTSEYGQTIESTSTATSGHVLSFGASPNVSSSGSSGFTILFAQKYSSGGTNATIFSEETSGTAYRNGLYKSTNWLWKTRDAISGDLGTAHDLTLTAPTVGVWETRALVWDKGSKYAYKDGVLDASASRAVTSMTTSAIIGFGIGGSTAASSAYTSITAIPVFIVIDRALTAAEIKEVSSRPSDLYKIISYRRNASIGAVYTVKPQFFLPRPPNRLKKQLNPNNFFVQNSIFNFCFSEGGGNSTDPHYTRKYAGVLSYPQFPQTCTSTGTDYLWEEGGIRLNRNSIGSAFATLGGVDSLSSASTSYSFLIRFKVHRFWSQGSSVNNIYAFGDTYSPLSLCIDSSDNLYINGAGAGSLLGAASYGSWHTVVVSHVPGGASFAYLNNKKVTYTGGGIPIASGNAFFIGSDGAGNRYADVTVSHLHILDIALSDAQALTLIADPWQLFKSQPKAITPPSQEVIPAETLVPTLWMPRVTSKQPIKAKLSNNFKPSQDALIFNAAEYSDIVTGKLPTANSLQQEITPYGVTIKNTYNSGNKLEFTNRKQSGNQVTFAFEARLNYTFAQNADFIATCSTINSGYRINWNSGSLYLAKGGVVTVGSLGISGGGDGWYRVICSSDSVSGNWYLYCKNLITGSISSASGNNTSTPSAGQTSWAISGGIDASPNASFTLAYIDTVFKPYQEMSWFLENPWQTFRTTPRPLCVPSPITGTPQLLVPVSDITKGTWAPSTGVDLYPMLDETLPDNTDYIYTVGHGDYFEVGLTIGNTPTGAGDYALSYQIQAGTGSGTIYLKQGATTIASWAYTQTGVEQTITQTLTSGQIASITDYGNLRVGGDTN